MGNIKFFESTQVKVFPCAYRGFTEVGSTRTLFNPESRAFTEQNFVNIYGKAGSNKESFIVDWPNMNAASGEGTLKCVIAGYYFEISRFTSEDLADADTLIIKTEQYDLDSVTSVNKTAVLESLNSSTETYLDTIIDGKYYFTGLGLIKNGSVAETEYTAKLQIWTWEDANTGHICYESKRLTDVLDTDTNEGSIRTIGTTSSRAEGKYAIALGETNTASGDNAIALGKQVTATENNSITIGNSSTNAHTKAVAIGSELTTDTDYQVVVGYKNTPNTNEDQSKHPLFVIGYDGNLLEVSKAGDIKHTGDLNTEGNLSVLGSAEINGGDLVLTKTASKTTAQINNVKLGSTRALDSGTLTIYGTEARALPTHTITRSDDGYWVINGTKTSVAAEAGLTEPEYLYDKNNTWWIGNVILPGAETPVDIDTQVPVTTQSANNDSKVFEVLNNGNTTIAGTLTIDKATTINDSLKVLGDITAENSTPSTHNLILGSGRTNDCGTISVYGTNDTKVFEVTSGGVTTIAGSTTITGATQVGSLTTAGNISAAAITASGKTTINNELEIKYSYTESDSAKTATTSINKNITTTGSVSADGQLSGKTLAINTNKFTVDENGNINIAGNITASGTFGAYGVGADASGNFSAKSFSINYGNAASDKIDLTRFTYSSKDVDEIRSINNTNALASSNGIHANGYLTCAGVFAIGEGSGEDIHTTTKISQGGTAYFKQKLIVGGTSDTIDINNTTDPDAEVLSKLGDRFFWVDGGNPNAAEIHGHAILNGKLYTKDGFYVAADSSIDGKLTTNSLKVINEAVILGNVTAATYNASSDLRLKQNIKDYVCEKSILDLPIKEFEYITDSTHAKHIGCIAQDLQEICPELVHEDANGYLAIEENKLVYLLLQEVKELKKEIKSLKGE